MKSFAIQPTTTTTTAAVAVTSGTMLILKPMIINITNNDRHLYCHAYHNKYDNAETMAGNVGINF